MPIAISAHKSPVGRFYFYSNSCTTPASSEDLSHGDRLSSSQLATLQCSATLDIFPGDQIQVGRNASLCRVVATDPTISQIHLRFHCVSLGTSCSGVDLQSLVYVEDVSTNGSFLYRSSYSPPDAISLPRYSLKLLEDNDQIRICSILTVVYRERNSNPKQACQSLTEDDLQALEKETFSHEFRITDRLLGQGGYGSVYLARHKQTHQDLACKVIDLRKLNEGNQAQGQLSKFDNEFNFLFELEHPNIVYLERVFKSNNTIYMFQELLTGGDLFSFVESSGGKLSEDVAAIIVQQILHGVEYLHSRNIVHRDLKPDNILLTRHSPVARVVITDFGHARKIESSQNRLFSKGVGTYEYAAPEIIGLNAYIDAAMGYSKAVDMWSVGAITAMLLTGYMLFSRPSNPNKNREQERQAFLTYLVHIDNSEEWLGIGRRPKAFVKRLLTLNERHRPTASQALKHPWFSPPDHRERFDQIYALNLGLWKEYHKCSDRSVVFIDRPTDQLCDESKFSDGVSMVDSPLEPPRSGFNFETSYPTNIRTARRTSLVLGHREYSS